MEKKKTGLIIFYVIALLFFGALFLTGTFFDESISKTLFSPDNMVIGLFTQTGVYPFFTAFVLFTGVLFERTFHSGLIKPLKIILCLACIGFAAWIGYFGGNMLASKSCFGYVFPSIIGNIPIIAAICLVFEYPMFFIGFLFAKKSDDKMLVQRIITLFVILVLAYITMSMMKTAFPRPRYRTVVLGYEGVGFTPWYSPLWNAGDFAKMYEIGGDEFRSFPSGHSILSVSSMYILPTLSWVVPKLKDKHILLCLIGFLFGCLIMVTRIIVGAHYLSDVSAGAMIATVLAIFYSVAQLCITSISNKRAEKQS